MSNLNWKQDSTTLYRGFHKGNPPEEVGIITHYYKHDFIWESYKRVVINNETNYVSIKGRCASLTLAKESIENAQVKLSRAIKVLLGII